MENNIINDIINQFWYDITRFPIESTDRDELSIHEDLLIASVVFTGKSEGSFTIAIGEAPAKQIASNMFNSAIEEITYDDIRDSIGELVNILAGNLKNDFFHDSELSKPIVLQGSDNLLSVFKIDAIFQKTYISSKKEELLVQVCRVE